MSCKSGIFANAHKPLGVCQRRRERKINVGFCSLNLSPVKRTSRILQAASKGLLWEISDVRGKPHWGASQWKRPFKLEQRWRKLTVMSPTRWPVFWRHRFHHDFERRQGVGGGDVRISQFRCLCPAVHLLWLWKVRVVFARVRDGAFTKWFIYFKCLVTAWSFLQPILGGLGGISGLEKVEALSNSCQFSQGGLLSVLRPASSGFLLGDCPESPLNPFSSGLSLTSSC